MMRVQWSDIAKAARETSEALAGQEWVTASIRARVLLADLGDEVDRLKSELEDVRRSHSAAKNLALRAARERNALTRMCVHTLRGDDEWWSFVGNFAPVPYTGLVKSGSEEEAKAVVRKAAATFDVTEELT